VEVIEVKDLPKMNIFGKIDAYCLLQMKGQAKVNKTKVMKKNYTPVWNEVFGFPVNDIGTDILYILIRDEDTSK
jgi:Ca2+-dependent lipid-binding protein